MKGQPQGRGKNQSHTEGTKEIASLMTTSQTKTDSKCNSLFSRWEICPADTEMAKGKRRNPNVKEGIKYGLSQKLKKCKRTHAVMHFQCMGSMFEIQMANEETQES